ncbi:MAG TPA: thiamine-phosphate kinase [Thermodesulfobacteriota bacterium]|nr:thiamine-phosphate kinase [Thermodesulfobacteriota bacterium]
MLRETAIIASFHRAFNRPAPGLIKGIGDDCAVFRSGGRNWLVTTDALVEGVHFRLETSSPYRLGKKCLAVNLSDIAAMGGIPRFAFLNLGLPKTVLRSFLPPFIKGLKEEAEKYSVALAGGDTHQSPQGISIGLTVIGEIAENPAYRSGAKVGDRLYVSGYLGQSAAGFRLLTKFQQQPTPLRQRHLRELIKAHQDPEPQVALGHFLVRQRLVRAMIDLSDGLASDLRHICRASGVGALLDADQIPLSPALRTAADALNTSPLQLALTGGEDYQLLFSVSKDLARKMETQVVKQFKRPVYPVGEIISGQKLFIKFSQGVRILKETGFDHFSPFEGIVRI